MVMVQTYCCEKCYKKTFAGAELNIIQIKTNPKLAKVVAHEGNVGSLQIN